MIEINFPTIDHLTNGRVGTFDTPCPLCGPFKSRKGQRRDVLRIWRLEPGWAGFHCARCGEHGYARDGHAASPDPAYLAKARAEAAEHARIHRADRMEKAQWLWSQRRPIARTIAETYLRKARGYDGPLPGTLAFLPGKEEYPPAMLAAFGIAHGVAGDGVLDIDRSEVRGVHITRLLPDGSDRERGDQAKIMVGHSMGSPIVLADVGDSLGLVIAEGIEDALAAHDVTGLGAWAAGCASRMPALAEAVPSYVEAITIVADDDVDGRRHATELAKGLMSRGLEACMTFPNRWQQCRWHLPILLNSDLEQSAGCIKSGTVSAPAK